MKGLLYLLIIMPYLSFSQNNGISFRNDINSWSELLEKARIENKHIFVDCYATWCGPCKLMDRDVYTDSSLGNLLNDKLIAVKVQMDSTDLDDETIRRWYADANSIRQAYGVNAFPYFLFFSPEGKLVHKDVGFKDTSGFRKLIVAALDESQQYETRKEKFSKGALSSTELVSLARSAQNLGEFVFANEIAKKYIDHLQSLPQDDLLNFDVINFFIGFSGFLTSEHNFFKLCYRVGDKVDSVAKHKGFSLTLVKSVIAKEEIMPKLMQDNKFVKSPDWYLMAVRIRKKYDNNLAKTLVAQAKLFYYESTKDWKKFVKLFDQHIRQHPLKQGGGLDSDSWKLNHAAWQIFLHCNDKEGLEKAIRWSDISITLVQSKPNVQYFDTKANLLYKLGRVDEAIACERRAIEIDKEQARSYGLEKGFYEKEYNGTIEKMKAGLPTWKTQ